MEVPHSVPEQIYKALRAWSSGNEAYYVNITSILDTLEIMKTKFQDDHTPLYNEVLEMCFIMASEQSKDVVVS